jgi:hypothetical protein
LTQARDRLERMEQEREFRQAELERINEEHRTSQEEAHLSAQAKDGEPIRVAHDGAVVDERAARESAAVTFSGPTGAS